MIIGVCGFGSTGSSAVSDFLMEYGNYVQVLDDIEFTWVSNDDSLIDLEYHLYNPHNRTTGSINAIRRYKEFAKRESCFLTDVGVSRKDVLDSTNKFLNEITMVKWNWYDFSKSYGPIFTRIRNRFIYKYIPKKEKRLGRQIKSVFMEEVSLSIKPNNFYVAAKKHVHELLSLMGATFDRPIILDQPFSGNNPQACFPFYEDPYAIVVDRDPRDNYVFAKTRLLGINHFMAIETVDDFIAYYKALRDNQPYKEESNMRVLRIQFEDMVYNYEEATKKIVDFLGFPENPAKKSIFDPSLSINNTQVWKRFPQFADDIKKIEKELKEYLFDFSKYKTPDLKGDMFFGKSPLHK